MQGPSQPQTGKQKRGRVPRADHPRSFRPPTPAFLRRIQALCQAPSAAPCGAHTPGCPTALGACASWHAPCSAPQRQPCRPALCSALRSEGPAPPLHRQPARSCQPSTRSATLRCGCSARRPTAAPRGRAGLSAACMATDYAEHSASTSMRRSAPRRGAPRPRRAQRLVGMATDCAEHCASTSMRRSASSSRSLRLGGTGTFSVATRHSTTFHSSCAGHDTG